MKYWVYMNNEVRGPFEKEKMTEIPDFTSSSLVCPEARDGEQSPGWKEASSYPDIPAGGAPASAPAAPQPQRPAPEDMLELTMRGSLVSAPEIEEPVTPPPPGQATTQAERLFIISSASAKMRSRCADPRKLSA